jgi:glyoxylase-like metal-dependent hydrolase (beta-lactamase superfamily II)
LTRWTVGAFTITSVLEEETRGIPPEFMFPEGTSEGVLRHSWLVPDFADTRGRLTMRVQAFVLEGHGRTMLIDPCVGNDKVRPLPYWHLKKWPFLENLASAGLSVDRIDTIVHTHLHADHAGWDTRLEGNAWVPTFPRARHLYTARSVEWCKKGDNPGNAGVYEDSVLPIFEAGLADMVDEDADLGFGPRLEASPGHTPGHVSLWIESNGEAGLISGDFLHHPVQCAEPSWREIADEDPDQARHTRRRMLARSAHLGALFVGTHFAARSAGRVRVHGDAFRFEPI